VKTEKEFSEIFVNACLCGEDNRLFVTELSSQYWTDMTSHLNRYFSNEDRLFITKKAGRDLSARLKRESPEDAWKNTIRDFTESGYWGYVSQSHKPAVQKTEDQKIFWKFFKYTWALFQAMILVKIAILFFGLKAAENPETTNQIWVWIACAFSLASLGYFAWRNRADND
jgi:hypothetical protein